MRRSEPGPLYSIMKHYTEISPIPLLQRVVECFWIMRSTPNRDADIVRILPDGCTDLIFNFADPIRNPVSDSTNPFHVFVVGNMTRFSLAKATGRFELLGIRFKPGGLYPFLNQPLFELTDQIIEGKMLSPNFGHDLFDLIAEQKTDKIKIEMLQRELLRRLQHFAQYDRAIDYSVRQILTHSGKIGIDQIASMSGISRRQLERKFQIRVGLSPKQLSQVVRFRQAQQAVINNPTMSLLNLAYDFGYFDHAHFTREFRRFAGMTPSDIRS